MTTAPRPDLTSSARKGDRMVAISPGIDLFLRWSRPEGTPKGTVLVVHGVGEHGGRYGNVEEALNRSGYSFYVYDHRGHGRSTGRRVYMDRFSDYVDDLSRMFEEVRVAAGGGKLFVYGHSMGALIVSTWAAFRRPAAWGVVLSGVPLIPVLPVPKAKIIAAKVLTHLLPKLALANEVDSTALSRDPAVGKAYELDPLVERKATVRWGAEMLSAIDELSARATELELPVLLVHGTADKICGVDGSRLLHERARSADKTLKLYEGAYHEVHNELPETRGELFRDVTGWLEARK